MTNQHPLTDDITEFVIRLSSRVLEFDKPVKALERKNDDFLRKLYGRIPESYQDKE